MTLSLVNALLAARRAGLDVRPVRRTGEVLIRDPATGRAVRHNARRKDASRALHALLRRKGTKQ